MAHDATAELVLDQWVADDWEVARHARKYIAIRCFELCLRGRLHNRAHTWTFLRQSDIQISAVLAAERPLARMWLLTRSAHEARESLHRGFPRAFFELAEERRQCIALRNAFGIQRWRERLLAGGTLPELCSLCGEPAFSWCAGCENIGRSQYMPLCYECEGFDIGRCQLCDPRASDSKFYHVTERTWRGFVQASHA